MTDQHVQPVPDKRRARIGAALIGVGAVIIWIALQFTWITVGTLDERTGAAVTEIAGSMWSSELQAIALLLLAAMVAGFALRRSGRRAVGTIAAVFAGAGLYWPAKLLIVDPSPERIESVLQFAAESTSGGAAPIGQVNQVDVSVAYPLLAVVGTLVALAGASMLSSQPGEDAATASKYETTASRRQKIEDDLAEDPDSGRVMWDALDADIDPTDRADFPQSDPGR
ncbi:TIGR02234 family membrane protein [Corynebacterium aquatimens]|uniref:Membrane protein (TIGR02234 family) n=1 Tax=Corynebacterium aquatimens TaxID=1190508 RepID=A0A931E289_9CORY|nr:TIGR02234 family membrane protein [Corynebacterium aquatimens]MBG6121916.1 putative membrane protein (TIGR02234 family) [Corynebacterium aquatimens]WJY65546.1 Tryptophan-associated transmembrane protein [Corynebacterium aquatimens]